MNKLTALRTFGQPSFCPVKRVRVYRARWYRVTLQRIETDPRTDYVGLADGEDAILVPGDQARALRDARLNHCNAIDEYRGEVWQVETQRFGVGQILSECVVSETEAHERVDAFLRERQDWLARWQQDIERRRLVTPASCLARAERTGVGIAHRDNPAYWEQQAPSSSRTPTPTSGMESGGASQ